LWAERVALLKSGSIVAGVGDRDARADRVARPKESAEVRLEGDPERGYCEVVPAAVAASAAATTNLTRSRFVGAQRARADALSWLMPVSVPPLGADDVSALSMTTRGLLHDQEQHSARWLDDPGLGAEGVFSATSETRRD
jgi:hypothetical protein